MEELLKVRGVKNAVSSGLAGVHGELEDLVDLLGGGNGSLALGELLDNGLDDLLGGLGGLGGGLLVGSGLSGGSGLGSSRGGGLGGSGSLGLHGPDMLETK